MAADTILGFIAVGLIAVIIPGPDFAVVTSIALRQGRRAGIQTTLGISLGILLWGVATSFGLSALLERSGRAFAVVKLLGAVYLLYLGIRTMAAALRSNRIDDAAKMQRTQWSTPFMKGLMTNLLNPKVGIFFLSLLPQFLDPRASFLEIELLAFLQSVNSFCWFTLCTVLVAHLRPLLAIRRNQRILDATTGSVFIGLGARIATEK